MKYWVAAMLLVPLVAGSMSADDFQRLDNGKDLTGWWAKDGKLESWKVENGVIVTPPADGGWLTTEKEYGDYELRLSWRIETGGNSGVGIRFPRDGRPWLEGVEIQLLDDEHPKHANLKPYQYTGSVYGISPPSKRAARPPGQWNTLLIRCQGPTIEVRVNDVVVNKISADDYATAEGDAKPLKLRARKGYIGLQAYGPRSEFKNIEIRELK